MNNINNFNDELEKVFKNLIEKARNSIKSELESTKEVQNMLTEYQTNLNDTIKDESKMSKIDKVQFIDDKTQVQIYKVIISDVIKLISKKFELYKKLDFSIVQPVKKESIELNQDMNVLEENLK